MFNRQWIVNNFVVVLVTAIVIVFVLHLRKFSNNQTIMPLESRQSLPFCIDNVHNKKAFVIDNEEGWMMRPVQTCRLFRYSQSEVIDCFDSLLKNEDDRIHVAFVGDSRIRQYYYNFMKFIPDYDRPWQDPANHAGAHVSRNITAPLIDNLYVSFHWLPQLNNELVELITRWADKEPSPPFYLLIGISLHHMVMQSFEEFEKGLIKIVPIMNRLSSRHGNKTQIVWLNQPPTIDLIPVTLPFHRPPQVDSGKIERYNAVVRRIFETHNSSVQIWDSSNHVVEEYVRSCIVQLRSAPQWIDTWMDCLDYVHPGYAALTHTIQLLLNNMCNHIVS